MANENLKLLCFWDVLLGNIQGKMAIIRSQLYAKIYEMGISVVGDVKRANNIRLHNRSGQSKK